MAKLSLKDKVCILISWALMLMCSAAEQEYFLQSRRLAWDEARKHCQVCFKDLVTLTPENIQTIAQNLTSDHWVGLRKNFSSTTNPSMFWSRWADGAPLTFQNWQPGQPVLESSFPNMDCCNCSCTNPTKTATGVTGLTGESKDTKSSSGSKNPSESFTTMSMMTSQSGLFSAAPDTDEKHIIDFCVAMLSCGAWIEQKCSELLPFICYEDRFFGQATVTNVTSSSAVLTWLPAPGNISRYRVQVKGDRELTTYRTDLTYDLDNLTSGTRYSVQVFPVKCERELNLQDVAFYTLPNKVENITVTVVKETSISLSWNKPAGNVDFYRIDVGGRQIQADTEGIEVGDLTSGSPYTFTVLSGVKDKSRWSEESNITAYTKSGKVSNLMVSENTNTSLLLNWVPPGGEFTGFMVKAMNNSSDVLFEEVVNRTAVRLTNLPTGTRFTLSVTALANHTLEGDKVTVINYTTPSSVSNLTLMTMHNSLTATWNPPERNDSSFTVHLQLGGETVKTQEKLFTHSVHFDRLKAAANYTVVVYTVNGHLRSPSVERYKFTLPLPPTDVTVTSGVHHITIQWKAPENTAADTYSVKISSSFWGHSWNAIVLDKTSHTFGDLKSGTKYEFEVSTVVDGKSSTAAKGSNFTVADKREISLSMICSSTERLLCNKNTTEEIIFRKLHAHFYRLLGDNIIWKLEMKETEN